MNLTRRDCLKFAGAALAASTAGFPLLTHAVEKEASLKDTAAAKGIRYGALADMNLDSASPVYRSLFLKQCGLCAVDIWPPAFSPGPDAFNFDTDENAIILAAGKHSLPITGAHLSWYYHMPDWFAQMNTPKDAAKAILGYAYGIAKHYQGKAWSWNAVNEALKPEDGQPLGIRQCWPSQQIGPLYIDLTFRAARMADPGALLVYNDYDFELNTNEHEARRSALLKLLDDLAQRKTPIDAVGLQSHLKYQQFDQFDDKRYRDFLKEIASRDLKIIITELDVLDVGAPSDIAERDRKVADVYARFLSVALDEPAVKAVVNWGLSDRYTWLNPKYSPAFIRPDGLATRPLPFDDKLNPTPVFDALLKAFKAAPQRTAA